jgi:hypothetical protein
MGLFSRSCHICGAKEGKHSETTESSPVFNPETGQQIGGGGWSTSSWNVDLVRCVVCGKPTCFNCLQWRANDSEAYVCTGDHS